jgi:DNA polymerase III subunit gamma/tau
MAYEPLHHKYRPQTFAELVGQEAITTTLINALRQQKIAPAYLFTGARGTGKTSSARILAKSLNCLQASQPTEKPCGACEVCHTIANGSALDVIEIDAASNTGVDNIRELIERSQFAPVQCRYKVYVIDECHMLSTAAFNALLKTLEEPPDRVIFVLATTDPQRVLPTIISRCQRFDFRRIELSAMVQHLAKIADQESINITPEAVQLVAQIAQGGLRDAESTLDQLSLLEGQITPERVWDLVGAVPERDLLTLVQAISQNDSTAVIERVRHLMDRGREPLIVLQNLASFYRDLLIAKTTPDRSELVAVTQPTWLEMTQLVQSLDVGSLLYGQQHLRASETQIKNTTQPRLWLEVTLLGLLPATLQVTLPSANGTNGTSRVASPPQSLRPTPAPPIPPPPPVPRTPAQSTNGIASKPDSSSNPVEPVTNSSLEHPPESPLKPPPEPPLESLPVPSSVNLEQVWQSVIELLQPPGTQALFKQQGRLLSLEGGMARIGITSRPLFKMAQQRLANLETALAQYASQPVKVSMEVVAAQTAEDSPIAHQVAEAIPSPQPVQPQSTPHSVPHSNGSVAEPKPTYSRAAPVSPEPQPLTRPEVAPAAQPWQSEDEVSRATKSLAQMFNGEIISCEGELLSASQSNGLEFNAGGTDLNANLLDDGDPDDDVPF